MVLDPTFFPVGFLEAAKVIWAEKAGNLLSSIQSAVRLTKETSVVAAKDWLDSQGVKRIFLSEAGLKNIYRTVGYEGKLVDLVAENSSRQLILVEAKSILDSARLRASFKGANKFETSIKALKGFYEDGGEIFPELEELIITTRKIYLSGRSSWSIREDGVLLKDKVAIVISGLPVIIRQIPF